MHGMKNSPNQRGDKSTKTHYTYRYNLFINIVVTSDTPYQVML